MPDDTATTSDGRHATVDDQDNDTRRVRYYLETTDGDHATITVEGYQKGSTAIRALIQAGHPENIIDLMETFVEEGDMSMVALALELGVVQEQRQGRRRHR